MFCSLGPLKSVFVTLLLELVVWSNDVCFCRKICFKFFFFKLEYTCFTMLCSFLLYNSVNQLYVYIYPFPFELPSLPPTHPSRSSQNTELASQCCKVASHWLSALDIIVNCISATLSICPTLPFSPCVHKPIHSLCLHLYSYLASRFIKMISFINFFISIS